jgi:hypothetical protein
MPEQRLFSAWSVPRSYLEDSLRYSAVEGSVENSQLPEAERVQLKKSSLEFVAVENWVEFWRWQYWVMENWHVRL